MGRGGKLEAPLPKGVHTAPIAQLGDSELGDLLHRHVNVEALVQGEIEDPLVYLEVIGEAGQPRIRRVDIKVYVDSPETEPIVRQLFEDVLARLPLVGTFRGAVHLDIQLILAA